MKAKINLAMMPVIIGVLIICAVWAWSANVITSSPWWIDSTGTLTSETWLIKSVTWTGCDTIGDRAVIVDTSGVTKWADLSGVTETRKWDVNIMSSGVSVNELDSGYLIVDAVKR